MKLDFTGQDLGLAIKSWMIRSIIGIASSLDLTAHFTIDSKKRKVVGFGLLDISLHRIQGRQFKGWQIRANPFILQKIIEVYMRMNFIFEFLNSLN